MFIGLSCFIKVSNLQNDYFYYDMEKHRLVGELTNKKYQLGDQINVVVEKADIIKKEIRLNIKN